MSEDNIRTTKGYVRTENVILTAILSVAVGFLLGVVFTVYRSGPSVDAISDDIPPQNQSASMTSQERKAEIASLKAETEKDPSSAQAWIALGNVYFDTQQVAKAINAYETAIDIDSGHADVWTDLGVMYRRNGQTEKALAAFDKAITLNPDHEISRFNKGIVLLHDQNDKQGAVAVWKELIGINPDAKAPNGQQIAEMIKQFSDTESR